MRMQHDLQSHQQNRLPVILLYFHGLRQQQTAVKIFRFLKQQLKLELYQSGIIPCFSDQNWHL